MVKNEVTPILQWHECSEEDTISHTAIECYDTTAYNSG